MCIAKLIFITLSKTTYHITGAPDTTQAHVKPKANSIFNLPLAISSSFAIFDHYNTYYLIRSIKFRCNSKTYLLFC